MSGAISGANFALRSDRTERMERISLQSLNRSDQERIGWSERIANFAPEFAPKSSFGANFALRSDRTERLSEIRSIAPIAQRISLFARTGRSDWSEFRSWSERLERISLQKFAPKVTWSERRAKFAPEFHRAGANFAPK